MLVLTMRYSSFIPTAPESTMNTVQNISRLAADCYDGRRCATGRATVNLQHIGQIAHQELQGPLRTQICDILCSQFCAVVIAERIVLACKAS